LSLGFARVEQCKRDQDQAYDPKGYAFGPQSNSELGYSYDKEPNTCAFGSFHAIFLTS
jgi:hypothetical protein